jgi:hypothetical protein
MKQICAHKLDSLEETDPFIKPHKWPRFNKDDWENWNISTTTKYIELVI